MTIRTSAAAALMLLAPSLSVAGPNDYFNLTMAKPANQLYLYAGANRFENDIGHVTGIPLELTLYTPKGKWDFSARTDYIDVSADGQAESGLSDTVLRATRNWRALADGAIDLVSLEAGGVFGTAASGDLHSDTNAFVRARTQFGPTRLKAELNAIVEWLDARAGLGDQRFTATAGFRSQVAPGWYVGADVLATNQKHVSQQTSLDFVLLRRLPCGCSIHLLYEQGVSSQFDDISRVELGFEWRLGR